MHTLWDINRILLDSWSESGDGDTLRYSDRCTKYICNTRRMFVSYQKANESEPMFIGNGTALKIEEKGKVILKLTSRKDLVLSNVVHVPNITKNMISRPILSNKGFKLVIESDKFVITKGGVYVGKGYLNEGLFKLSVVTDDNAINNNNASTITASVYMIDPSFLWHSRLVHVNYRSLQRMINVGMLPKSEVENQLDKKIKILRSDRGGKYESNDFSEFCSTFGIVHQTTTPYTPQQNGVAERKNRTLKNMINSMLITSGAPHSLWGEACLAANTILNKIPHKKSDKSAYQLWTGKQPSYKRMKVWGCLAKVQIPLPKRTKLGPKTVDCVYLGPAKNSAAYRFLDKEKQISNLRKRVMNDQLSQDETNNNYEVPQENVEPRRSKRAKVTKDFGPDYMTYIVNEEPQTYKAAMESSEAPYWKEAIQSEIDLIVHNNTWKLVDLPSGHKPIGHKWIFKKKLRPDGIIENYKVCLVAKGYRQKEGQDFFDTYSPVTRITSIRTLIAITTIQNL
ncbi:retrovirus-related pol polyprotein from transposon TNT 1-94 [Tanacetum coccineum]